MNSADSRRHMPGASWEFDESVTEVFPDMLRRSIPNFSCVRELSLELIDAFRTDGGLIADIGCSDGGSLREAVEKYGGRNRYYGCDNSASMLRAASAKFKNAPEVKLCEIDLRNELPDMIGACVTQAIFTMQFLPISRRIKLARHIFEQTEPGGAFLMFEKISGSTEPLDLLMIDVYHREKMKNGFSLEAVEAKRKSLIGVLNPATANWNERLLLDCGFSSVDCVWRWMNFAGWVAVK